ncbi:MAG TPA: mechanosensitive ion channel domain-containing protein [Burkholderiales bacterium]|nr:mechanosensitive ion channel domain-containing protein [Burkholderiales bacterium]
MEPGSGTAEIHNLIVDLLADVRSINVLWQVGVLAVCLGLAWWVARLVRARLMTVPAAEPGATLKISVGGLNRIIFPLSALLFVLGGRFVLHRFQHEVHLLNLAVPLLFSLMLVRVIVYVLRRAFKAGSPLRNWERAIAWTIWIGVALHITGLLPGLLELLDGFGFHVGRQRISVLNILQGLLSVAITVVIALWAGQTIEGRLMAARGLDLNLRVVLSKLARTLLVIIAVLVALPAVGIDVTVLSVFGGAVGVGLGLGLQKIAANYVSGFVILLDRSISPGALVTIEGRYGEVTKLTGRYLVVKAMDGTEAIIPNETVITSVVVNHSYSDRRVRVDLPIQVSYASDVDRALELMLEASRGHTRVLRDPAPAALLKGFGDSGIDLELYVWVADPEAGTGNLRSDLYRTMWKSFSANGIAIPFPQREVRILGSLQA